MKLFPVIKKQKLIFLSSFSFLSIHLLSQTLIINEVSNGPSGNKEYIELVVADSTAFYNCGNTVPPCIDIRGWIIDDNSGYHGAGGIAAGANRFSQDPLWSCVPLGTIILVYNDADVNADIPAMDLVLNDGNCNITAPISNTSLFETNTTTPGAIACSYPPTGWIPGGDWSSTLLANSGDCTRIVDLNGCEVFSLCWASCSTSTQIYFNSGMSGTDNVWYFNDGDATQQINWSEGCTDPSTCGTNEQTPGAPNNIQNQNYISQFNNNCQPIIPISVLAISTDASCMCDGSANANASGSIPGYSYLWYDNSFSGVISTDFSVTGLCSGTYHVIATSQIGCSDTATVVINSNGSLPVAIPVSNSPVCEGDTIFLFGNNVSGAVYEWSGPDNFSSSIQNQEIFFSDSINEGTYTLIIHSGNCSSLPATVFVDIVELPVFTVTSNSPVCTGDTIFLQSTTAGMNQFLWTGPDNFSSSSEDPIIINSDSTNSGLYILTVVSNGCQDTAQISVTILTPVSSIINMINSICENGAAFSFSASPAGGTWSGTGIVNPVTGQFDPAVSGPGSFEIIYSFNNSCIANDSVLFIVNPSPFANAGIDTSIYCSFSSLMLDGSQSSGGTLTYSWYEIIGNISVGGQTSTPTITNPGYYVLSVTDQNGCTDYDTIHVNYISGPNASFTASPQSGNIPLDVQTINNSTGSGLTYQWINCINDTSVLEEPIFTLDTSGNCYFILIVTDENNCVDTAFLFITALVPYSVFVPNVFTPNGDQSNDLFKPLIEGAIYSSLEIYNRWGQVLSITSGSEPYWDGKYRDEFVSDGTYYFTLHITLPDQSNENFSGHVTLLR